MVTRSVTGVILSLIVLAAFALVAPTPADAQTGWSVCPHVRIVDNTAPMGFPARLDPGVYEVEISVGDAYADRPFADAASQRREQVQIVLHTATGAVTSQPNPDLIDGVADASWRGSLGQVVAETPVGGIEIVHVGPKGGGANSLNVHCIWVYRVIEVPLFATEPALMLGSISLGAFWLRHRR